MDESTKSISEYLAQKKRQDDSISKFCDYLCCRLKELKKKHRRAAMYSIESIMQKAEIENDSDEDE